MNTNLIPSLKETLFDPAVSIMSDSLTDIAELSGSVIAGMVAQLHRTGCSTGSGFFNAHFFQEKCLFLGLKSAFSGIGLTAHSSSSVNYLGSSQYNIFNQMIETVKRFCYTDFRK